MLSRAGALTPYSDRSCCAIPHPPWAFGLFSLTQGPESLFSPSLPLSLSSSFFFLTSFIPAHLPVFLCPFTKYCESFCFVPDTPLHASLPYPTLLTAPGEYGPQWSCMLQLLLRQASKFLPTRFLAVSELSERQMLLGGDSILRDSYMRNLPKVGKV